MSTQIDPRGPRFGAAITSVLSLAGLYFALEGHPYAAILTLVLFVLFAWNVFAPKSHPYSLLFTKVIRPRLAPPQSLEDSRPPRFAQQVGFGFSILALLGLAPGLYALNLAGFGFIFAAAFLNSVFNYCLGCQMYLLLKRAGLIGN